MPHTNAAPYFRLTRYPYEEPFHVNLVVDACDGGIHGQLEVYAKVDDLVDAARGIAKFLRHDGTTEVLLQLGSDKPADKYAFYFRARIFQVDGGQCAVAFRLCNNRAEPQRQVTELSILAQPADLARLAELLRGYVKLQHRVMEWRVTEGELRD